MPQLSTDKVLCSSKEMNGLGLRGEINENCAFGGVRREGGVASFSSEAIERDNYDRLLGTEELGLK